MCLFIRFKICFERLDSHFFYTTILVDLDDRLSRIQMRIYESRKYAKVTALMKDIHFVFHRFVNSLISPMEIRSNS